MKNIGRAKEPLINDFFDNFLEVSKGDIALFCSRVHYNALKEKLYQRINVNTNLA